MSTKNKYVLGAPISETIFRQLIRLFAEDLTATQIAHITRSSRPTINHYVVAIRHRILALSQRQSAPLIGQIEVDESYFGARRVKGVRGRGARGKIIVFSLLKRGDKVYTEIVPDCTAATRQGIIGGKMRLESVIYADGWRGYEERVDYGYKKHIRVHHGANEFASSHAHINGIESFWAYAKIRLVKFKGMDKKSFHLYLKECAFRFNNRKQKIYTGFY